MSRRPVVDIALGVALGMTFWACTHPPSQPANPEPLYPPANRNGDPIFAVFFNRVPCSSCKGPIGPASKVKVELVLYADRETRAPTTYRLGRVYAARSADDRNVNEGTWTIKRGAKSCPQAPVYELDAKAPAEFRSYLLLSDDVLFLLDQQGNPRIGNGFFAYTLNRTR